MARRPMHRLYEAVARAAQRRDKVEMQAIDRLLSPLALKRVCGGIHGAHGRS